MWKKLLRSRPTRVLAVLMLEMALVARWLATRPAVLLLDEPTKGIDVAAKAEVHQIIRSLARAGTAVLLVSSEMVEVLAMADPILVMSHGRLAGSVPAHLATKDHLLRLAMGKGTATGERGAGGNYETREGRENGDENG